MMLDKHENKTIAERKIREGCIERGWSLDQLSKELSLSRQSLYNYFSGKIQPSIETRKKLKALFGVQDDWV